MMYRGLLLSLLSAVVIFKVDNSSRFYSFFRRDLFVLEELNRIISSHQFQSPLYYAVLAVLLLLYIQYHTKGPVSIQTVHRAQLRHYTTIPIVLGLRTALVAAF